MAVLLLNTTPGDATPIGICSRSATWGVLDLAADTLTVGLFVRRSIKVIFSFRRSYGAPAAASNLVNNVKHNSGAVGGTARVLAGRLLGPRS